MSELAIAILTALSGLLQQEEATILFAGDAMMHQRQIDAARTSEGNYDYSEYFQNVMPLITEADYAVVNLETPLSRSPYSGYPTFNSPDSYAVALKDAGFDLFLTANNHTLDRHDRGLKHTIETLDSLGVDQIGTYFNASDRNQKIPFIKDISGFKIGFLNYTYGTNGITIQGDVAVDYIDRNVIAQDIKKTRAAGAELICVMIHWGDEYKLLPNNSQKALADFLQNEGVELIIGSHPHVIQPAELTTNEQGNNLVVYSLGNFISGMRTTDTRGGAIVRAHLKRDVRGKAYIDSADYDLVFTVPANVNKSNFHLIFADSCNIASCMNMCDAFKTNANRIYNKHNINVNKRQISK